MEPKVFSPRVVAHYPEPAEGYFDIAYSVTERGEMAILCADFDLRAEWKNRYLTLPADYLPFPGNVRARLSVFDGHSERECIEFPLETPFPNFDQLPDGGWIVADARCSVGKTNARRLSPQGDLINRLCLGDGIDHLFCDTNGDVWVGYFDDGVSGNEDIGNVNDTDLIGAPGLVRFNARGEPLWRFDPLKVGKDSKWTRYRIADCYALNVKGRTAVTYYYDAFPIVEIAPDGSVRSWRSSVNGACALAVSENTALLLGGYSDDDESLNRHTPLTLLEFFGGKATPIANFEIDLSFQHERSRLGIGRGDTLHIFDEGKWMQITVAEVKAFAARL